MKGNFNIPDKTMDFLQKIFPQNGIVNEVVLCGSRAKGTHTERSDIDLVIRNSQMDRHQLGKIKLDIDNSDIPYMVDIQIYENIKNPRLREHIDRVGMVILSQSVEFK